MDKKLTGLQTLRGIAALLVCCFHARMLLNGDFNYGIFFFGKGNIGVPLFFIISGFIMVYSTENLSVDAFSNFKSFLLKRILRIVPLYYVLTLTIIFISYTLPYYLEKEGFIELVRILLFIPKGNDTPLLVGWTLSYEFLFYLLFAFSLLFHKWRYYFLYACFILFVFIIPLFSDKPVSFQLQEANYFDSLYLNLATNAFMLYFMAGMLIGNTYSVIKLSFGKAKLLLFASIAIFTAYYFKAFSFAQSDLFVCALLVFAVLHYERLKPNTSANRFLTYLGDLSYSIYLMHPIMVIFLPATFRKIGLTTIADSKFIFLFVVLFTVLASMVTYNLIEKRLTNFIKRRFLKERR